MAMRLFFKEEESERPVALADVYPLNRVIVPLWQASLFDWGLLLTAVLWVSWAVASDNWLVVTLGCAGYLLGHVMTD